MVAALFALACASLVLAGTIGSVAVPLSDLPAALLDALRGQGTTLASTLVDLRLTRALVAFVTGAALALAGVLMQALLRNPLADPYVLGISAGASVGALAALLFMCAAWMVDGAAFAGAAAISLLLYSLARRDLRADGGATSLLLTGVILSSGCMALVTLMLSIAPEGRLRGMIGGALLFAMRNARALNVIAMHAEGAAALGIRVGPLRKGLFCCSGLLTASAVTTAGSIGFVGLIVPHACRFALGPDHRLLVPAAALAGGTFLVLADTLARTIAAPQQLPVGVVTALLGAPVFLFQLHRLRRP
jgi:iron complex transport system permease protein